MPKAVRRSQSAQTYRWVFLWLIAGALLALLLMANSIRDYRFVSRLLITQQVRHQMSQHVVALEHQLRQSWHPGDSRLKLLNDELNSTADRPLWIELRRTDGTVLEAQGNKEVRAFTDDEQGSHFRNREPLYKVVPTSHGDAVVEAFAVFVPGVVPNPPDSAAPSPPGPRSALIVEMAMPLTAASRYILGPQRQNLIINCSGALALLAMVIIAGVGFRSYVRGKRLEEQLEIAQEVQSALLPVLPESLAGVGLAVEFKPAERVGGDFFDAFPVNRDGLALVIGDVSGKGVPAALLVGVIHGAVRSSAWAQSTAQQEHESAKLNHLLCERASGERYASLFWSYYDPASRILRYVNAGHCPPLLVRVGGSDTNIANVNIVALTEGGPVLGLLGDARYQQTTQAVSAGDILVLYSDGLVEATNVSGEEFGELRLRERLAAVRSGSPAEVRDAIVTAVIAFLNGVPPHDDLTLVVAKFD